MKDYIIFDAHCDTLFELLERGEVLYENSCHVSISHMEKYRGYIQFFAAWIDENATNWLSEALGMIDKLYEEIEKNRDAIAFVTDYKGLKDSMAGGKIAALLAIEDSRALCKSLANLRILYRLGVRMMTLTWNSANDVADGILTKDAKGLTHFGKQVIAEMNGLGMIIDLSHISEKGFWEVMELSEKPVLASHSNAYSICDNPRNLKDDQIKALIQTNGIVGLNMYPMFLNNSEKASISHVIRHIDHFLSLGAENHIGMGTDFDGISILPDGIFGGENLYLLFDEMLKLGYNYEIIEKITHQNFLRFMKENL